jgi:hypothetical protein
MEQVGAPSVNACYAVWRLLFVLIFESIQVRRQKVPVVVTPAVKTPAVKTPAVKTPAVRTQIPPVRILAVRTLSVMTSEVPTVLPKAPTRQ